jgi:hypothetical protein
VAVNVIRNSSQNFVFRYVCKMSKGKMSKMKNVEREKRRNNKKSGLMLIVKYLFDFNKKKKNTFITGRYQFVTVHYESPAFFNFLLDFRIAFLIELS